MTPQPANPYVPDVDFQEVYFNKHLTGTLLFPFMKAVVQTFGTFFYFLIISLVLLAIPLAFLIDWQNFAARILEQWEHRNFGNILALALVTLLGFFGLLVSIQMVVKIWATFLRVARSRLYFGSGQPLACVEGVPTFSGGRRSGFRLGGKAPDKLEVGDRSFDLNHCWRVSTLLELSRRNFVGTEPLASGIASGFTLQTPFRAWYVPATGVLARVEIRAPGQIEIVRRAQRLEEGLADWYRLHASELSASDVAKTQRLSEELKSLRMNLARNASAVESKEAENRLATLEDWLSALGIRIDDRRQI